MNKEIISYLKRSKLAKKYHINPTAQICQLIRSECSTINIIAAKEKNTTWLSALLENPETAPS